MPDNINNDPSVNPQQQIAATQPQAGQPSVPPTPTVTPAVSIPAAAPTAQPNPAGQPQTPPVDPHAAHVGMFDKILRMVNPGISYVDANGDQQVVRNRATLGNSVIASVLAGMMTPTKYREGSYGPVVSGDATAAGAFQAGRGQQQKTNDAAQKASDDARTKKLSIISNNLTMAHQYAALAQQQHQELQGVAERNQSTILRYPDTRRSQHSVNSTYLSSGPLLGPRDPPDDCPTDFYDPQS